MKKMILGVSLLIGGIIGIAFSMLSVAVSCQALGTVNDSSSMFAYLGWFGMTPLFVLFVILSVLGIAICVKEAYFSKGIK